ncbi:phosphotransferase [Actinomadura kijaniata]|uniref:phosphotransferase n=1 Tax=Actinomadura kijaniata TaxID=46161 RepID=UPI003F1D2085
MTDFRVPDSVAEGVRIRWPDRGSTWLATVEAEFKEICARYAATPVTVLSARYGFVVEVRAKNTSLVIRSSPDPAGAYQAAVSQALAKLGVGPQIYEVAVKPTGTWTIAERIVPGTPVRGRPVTLDELVALLSPIRAAGAPAAGMPALVDWLQTRLEDDALSDRAPGTSVASEYERAEALSILADLATTPMNRLCHGDASAGNILTAEGGRLVFIDPRGVQGEVAYDVAVAAMKTTSHKEQRNRATALARQIGVSADRVVAWLTVAVAARV